MFGWAEADYQMTTIGCGPMVFVGRMLIGHRVCKLFDDDTVKEYFRFSIIVNISQLSIDKH